MPRADLPLSLSCESHRLNILEVGEDHKVGVCHNGWNYHVKVFVCSVFIGSNPIFPHFHN